MTDRARLVLVTPRFASQDAAAGESPAAPGLDRPCNALAAALDGRACRRRDPAAAASSTSAR